MRKLNSPAAGELVCCVASKPVSPGGASLIGLTKSWLDTSNRLSITTFISWKQNSRFVFHLCPERLCKSRFSVEFYPPLKYFDGGPVPLVCEARCLTVSAETSNWNPQRPFHVGKPSCEGLWSRKGVRGPAVEVGAIWNLVCDTNRDTSAVIK